VKQRGRIDSVTAAVGDAAGALRRRREARQPYVKLYDAAGEVRMPDPASPEAQALIDTATGMVDAVEVARKPAKSENLGASATAPRP
jgi:hypothetical protein